jgi:hypothetical protein
MPRLAAIEAFCITLISADWLAMAVSFLFAVPLGTEPVLPDT